MIKSLLSLILLITTNSIRSSVMKRSASGVSLTAEPPRKRHRPGFNSYLTIVLSDSSMQTLYDQMTTIRDFVKKDEYKPPSDDTKISEKGLKIRRRSLKSLHLTFLFGGEAVSSLEKEVLLDWHKKVSEILSEAGFGKNANPFDKERFQLNVKEFRIFPPKKKYLVVAELESSPAWQELYTAIREISPPEIQALANHEIWLPHVTLANIQGRDTKQRVKLLESLEKTFTNTALSGHPLKIEAIDMGGPIPSQAELDWRFSTCYVSTTSSEVQEAS